MDFHIMATYDYQCNECSNVQEERHGMMEEPIITCNECSGTCRKVILTPPSTVIPPHMQATGSKFKYYGIDPITGDGITEDTNVMDKPGVRVKPTKK